MSDLFLEPRRSGRVVTVTANKAAEEWWDKLTDGPKPHNVKVDWASWKDEDEGVRSAGVPLKEFCALRAS